MREAVFRLDPPRFAIADAGIVDDGVKAAKAVHLLAGNRTGISESRARSPVTAATAPGAAAKAASARS